MIHLLHRERAYDGSVTQKFGEAPALTWKGIDEDYTYVDFKYL
ncbi:MAG: hypothetical protein Q4G33_06160 [bacterium]|nr:hypothetical protein [bacterium]